MSSLKVSVITVERITVYNNRLHIEQALASLRKQIYPNIEHILVDGGSTATLYLQQRLHIEQQNTQTSILVDGGSTDGTTEYLKTQLNKKSLLISEPDNGIYDALNKGIAASTGDIVGFLHSDDLLARPETLSLIAHEFKNNPVEAVYGDLVYVNQKDPSKVIRYWKSGEYHLQKIKYGWMPPHPTFYMKKKLL